MPAKQSKGRVRYLPHTVRGRRLQEQKRKQKRKAEVTLGPSGILHGGVNVAETYDVALLS